MVKSHRAVADVLWAVVNLASSQYLGVATTPFCHSEQCDAQRAEHASEESPSSVAQLSSDVVDSSRARRYRSAGSE